MNKLIISVLIALTFTGCASTEVGPIVFSDDGRTASQEVVEDRGALKPVVRKKTTWRKNIDPKTGGVTVVQNEVYDKDGSVAANALYTVGSAAVLGGLLRGGGDTNNNNVSANSSSSSSSSSSANANAKVTP